uniref:Uncharacterized protein n=1 Tax=Nelumbo nucifera TaxID=4432 RepID=A0A822XNF5_NELNU|nr:TPA_asm: hypothetical protein HUJ06_022042 [Nelumbo nucifera]
MPSSQAFRSHKTLLFPFPSFLEPSQASNERKNAICLLNAGIPLSRRFLDQSLSPVL